MSEEFKYIPYSPYDENIRGLVRNGGVYNLKNATTQGAAPGYERGMSGLFLPGEDADMYAAKRDIEYMKSMYPEALRPVSEAVSEECDKLEYEGSPMLALYPDREEMRRVAREVYDKLDSEGLIRDEYKVSYADSVSGAGQQTAAAGPASAYDRGCAGGPGCAGDMPPHSEPPYIPDGPGCSTCIMRNIIELMVCDEFCMRRDRHRRHRRKFY